MIFQMRLETIIPCENNNRDEHTRTLLFSPNASAFGQVILFFDCALENFFHCFSRNVREPIIVWRLSLLARMRSVEKGGPTLACENIRFSSRRNGCFRRLVLNIRLLGLKSEKKHISKTFKTSRKFGRVVNSRFNPL